MREPRAAVRTGAFVNLLAPPIPAINVQFRIAPRA
jgi:hypothetical protein